MRILFLSERFPYPLDDGGNLRTFHVLQGLSSCHDVHLVAHGRSELDQQALSHVQAMCKVTIVKRPSSWQSLSASALRGRAFSLPLFLAKNWSVPLLQAAERLLKAEVFDAIHFNHLDAACYVLARQWPQFKVFDTHNCLSDMAQQLSATASPGRRLLYSREARKLLDAEREVCRRMNIVLTCSDEEQAAFQALAENQAVLVAPNGVDCRHFVSTPAVDCEEPGSLVFTGAMDYFPNQDAALFLCREILPRLADLRPRPKIYLVGKNPPAALRSLHDGATVIVTGRVPDIRPYLRRAMLVVVPLRQGAGTRLKILEAFAMGKAVASTHKGAEGIPAIDGEEILLASDAMGLAAQIRRAWESPELRSRLGIAAARLAQDQFDWPRIQKAVLAAYRTLEENALTAV